VAGRRLHGEFATWLLAFGLTVIGFAMLLLGFRDTGPPGPANRLPVGVSQRPAFAAGLAADARERRYRGDAEAPPHAGPVMPPVMPPAVPVSLDIPSIGVHARVSELGLNPDGSIALPEPTVGAPAGWYRYLSTPGEPGPAVILGHVDARSGGPAVFYRLGDLRIGDRITVRRADGSAAEFTVDTVSEYPKTNFPVGEVYGQVPYPALRLITCGGRYDHAQHAYPDNVVVYARLTAAHPAGQVR
jgi:sortase (surface protein transpeptidase)